MAIFQVSRTLGFSVPGALLARSDGTDVQAIVVNHSRGLLDLRSTRFGKFLYSEIALLFRDSWVKKVAQQAVASTIFDARSLGFKSDDCLFIHLHGAHEGVVPEFIDGYDITTDTLSAEAFAKKVVQSVDLSKTNFIFLYSCYSSKHAAAFVEATDKPVIAGEGVFGSKLGLGKSGHNLKYFYLLSEDFGFVTSWYRAVLDSDSSLEKIKSSAEFLQHCEDKGIDCDREMPKNIDKLLQVAIEGFHPEKFPSSKHPELYGNLWRYFPNEEKKIISSEEFPMLTRENCVGYGSELDKNPLRMTGAFAGREPSRVNTMVKGFEIGCAIAEKGRKKLVVSLRNPH